MCLKSKRIQHGYRNKWIKNINQGYHVTVNVNLMEQNVSQINGGVTINVDVSVKNIMYVKKIMFGIFLNVIVKMGKI